MPWLATPTSMAALEQSRTLGPTHTSYHCCLLHRSGTDTAHCTAWTTHSNSAMFSWPTIETSAWQMDRSPTTSHSTGRLCITPVVLIVVPLLLLLPPLLSLLFLYSSPLSLRCRVYTVLHVSPFLSEGCALGGTNVFPIKAGNDTLCPTLLHLVPFCCTHQKEATEAIYIHAPAEFTTVPRRVVLYSFCCVRVLLSQSQNNNTMPVYLHAYGLWI